VTIEFKGFRTRVLRPESEKISGNFVQTTRDFEGNQVSVRSIDESTQLGFGATASGLHSIALGFRSNALEDESVAVGLFSRSLGFRGIAVGEESNAQKANSIAIGTKANAGGVKTVVIGKAAYGQGAGAVIIGDAATGNTTNQVVIGAGASAIGSSAVAIGQNASATATSATVIGRSATATGLSTAIGQSSQATGASGVALGNAAQTSGTASMVLGPGATSTGDYAIAIGNNADNATHDDSIAIGRFAANTATNQVVIGAADGTDSSFYNDVIIGNEGNGQLFAVKALTELTTIAAAATTDTAIQIPADAVVLGVSVRVTVSIDTAVTFDYGVSGATTRYGTGISDAVGTTNDGTDDGPRYYSAATSIRITPNATPGAADGRVRVTIVYYEITPPTS